jgi:hypothetical protein
MSVGMIAWWSSTSASLTTRLQRQLGEVETKRARLA